MSTGLCTSGFEAEIRAAAPAERQLQKENTHSCFALKNTNKCTLSVLY